MRKKKRIGGVRADKVALARRLKGPSGWVVFVVEHPKKPCAKPVQEQLRRHESSLHSTPTEPLQPAQDSSPVHYVHSTCTYR